MKFGRIILRVTVITSILSVFLSFKTRLKMFYIHFIW